MIHMIDIILTRTLSSYSPSWSETQFEKVLHIIGVALHEEEKDIINPLEEGSPVFLFSRKILRKDINNLMDDCLRCSKVESHQDLLKWTIDKLNTVIAKRGYNLKTSDAAGSSSSIIRSPSQCSMVDEKKRLADLAAKRRARIMAQMSSQQQSFISQNSQFFQDMSAEDNAAGSLMDIREFDDDEPVAVGMKQRGRMVKTESHTCILCREEQEVTSSGRCLVLAAYVQRSTVLSKNRERKVNFTEEAVEAVFMPADLYFGPHVSTCGHVMHSDCWQKYFEAVLAKERRRPVRYGRHVSFDVDKSEFLCPLCECLSNTVIPVIPALTLGHVSQQSNDIAMSDWLEGLHAGVVSAQPIWVKDPSPTIETGEKYICRLKPSPLSSLEEKTSKQIADLFVQMSNSYEEASEKTVKLSPAILEMMKLLSQAIYTIGLNVHHNPEDDRVPVLSYWSCAFTIHAIERVVRDEGKTIFSDLSSRKFNCLQALVRYAGVSSAVFNAAVTRTHAIKLLKYLLVSETNTVSPTSILDIDAFGLLTSLIMSSPSMYVREEKDDPGCILTPPSGNVFDKNFINLILTLHLVQIVLTNAAPFEEGEDMETDLE
jgi:E3 ubiquitin-protein ligase UBR2